MNGIALSAAYRRAGGDLLAQRIEGMFRQLKTPEDVALHNAIQKEIMAMVPREDAAKFYQTIQAQMLFEKKKARKRFRDIVSWSILSVAKG